MSIPTIHVAIVLSILVHIAALWILLPRLRSLTLAQASRPRSSLAVQLVPRKDVLASVGAPRSPPVRASTPTIVREPEKPRAPRHVAPKRSRPPVIARAERAPAVVVPIPAPAPAPAPAGTTAKPAPMPPAPTQDLSSYIAAQRAARGEAPPSDTASAGGTGASDDAARINRIVAANLGLDRKATYGNDSTNAGGLFQITELGYDSATFYFFGFDKDIRRNARQLIEVRRGHNADIRIAIVRRMISIIRDGVRGDFVWVSQRTGRSVTLSARPEDNAGLEEFILHDVFPNARLP
ncbi:MAG: hypothetical protein ACREX6_00075 [Casimicrobiaceae bacterium]